MDVVIVIIPFLFSKLQAVVRNGPGSVLIIIAVIAPHNIIVLFRLFLFGLDHSAQVPSTEVLPYGWRETDDT